MLYKGLLLLSVLKTKQKKREKKETENTQTNKNEQIINRVYGRGGGKETC